MSTTAPHSAVLEAAPLTPDEAARELFARLAMSTDPSDVHADLAAGAGGFLVVDARSGEAYARGHIPGAVSFPHRLITSESTAGLSREVVLVTYCDGVHCNASTKAAWKLARLGFRVKEMTDGLEGWCRDGFEVEVGAPSPRASP
ncbi:MAG TPA: rhodanese-like domain-containing protein [Anaeromyxobacteraceae bacterium]|nr:rhodanese-like domain-containing protein [Anaeromyxobacteraceae bacterium]